MNPTEAAQRWVTVDRCPGHPGRDGLDVPLNRLGRRGGRGPFRVHEPVATAADEHPPVGQSAGRSRSPSGRRPGTATGRARQERWRASAAAPSAPGRPVAAARTSRRPSTARRSRSAPKPSRGWCRPALPRSPLAAVSSNSVTASWAIAARALARTRTAGLVAAVLGQEQPRAQRPVVALDVDSVRLQRVDLRGAVLDLGCLVVGLLGRLRLPRQAGQPDGAASAHDVRTCAALIRSSSAIVSRYIWTAVSVPHNSIARCRNAAGPPSRNPPFRPAAPAPTRLRRSPPPTARA